MMNTVNVCPGVHPLSPQPMRPRTRLAVRHDRSVVAPQHVLHHIRHGRLVHVSLAARGAQDLGPRWCEGGRSAVRLYASDKAWGSSSMQLGAATVQRRCMPLQIRAVRILLDGIGVLGTYPVEVEVGLWNRRIPAGAGASLGVRRDNIQSVYFHKHQPPAGHNEARQYGRARRISIWAGARRGGDTAAKYLRPEDSESAVRLAPRKGPRRFIITKGRSYASEYLDFLCLGMKRRAIPTQADSLDTFATRSLRRYAERWINSIVFTK